MKRTITGLMVIAWLSIAGMAQRTTYDSATITVSGTSTPKFYNTAGGMTASFSETINGSPATVSIVIQGCSRDSVCKTIDTNTTTTSAIRTPTLSDVYDYFVVTPSWTGGTNVSVVITPTATTARSFSSGGGAPLNSPAFTGNPTAPTPATGDSSTSVATTAFVDCGDTSRGINIACPPYYASGSPTTTTTVGTTGVGTSVVVSSSSSWKCNGHEGIYIAGAGSAGANYIGTVTACSGTSFTISPATSTSVNAGAVVKHDETAAIQACMNVVSLTANALCFFPDGTYNVNGAPTTVNGQTSILHVPTIDSKIITLNAPINVLTLKGSTRAALNASANEGGSASNGGVIIQTGINTNNVISGAGSNSGGNSSAVTAVHLHLENLTIRVPTNPNINGVNCTFLMQCSSKGIELDTASLATTAPTGTGNGLMGPGSPNWAMNRFEDVVATGWANGIVATEHSQYDDIMTYANACGFEVDVNNNYHGFEYNRGTSFGNTYNLCTTSPGGGVVIGSSPVFFSFIEFERDQLAPPPDNSNYPATTYDINDPNNILSGTLNYEASPSQNGGFSGSDGVNFVPFVNGGLGLNICSLQANGTCTDALSSGYPTSGVQAGLLWQPGGLQSSTTNNFRAILVSRSPHRFQITLPPNLTSGSSAAENGWFTGGIPNFTGKSLAVCEQDNLSATDAVDYFGMYVGKTFSSSANYLVVEHYLGSIYFVKNIAGSSTVIANTTYSPVAHKCWRVRESSGAVVADTAPTITGPWTTLGTCSATCVSWSYTTNVFVGFSGSILGSSTSSANPGYAEFSQFTQAAGTSTGTALQDQGGITSVANGGTGVSAAHGNGSRVQLSDNTGSSGDLAKYDANGNVVDGPPSANVPLAANMVNFFPDGANVGAGTIACSAGATKVWGFVLPYTISTTSVGYTILTNADNSANTYDIGIYDSAGTLKVHIGSTAGTTFSPSTGLKSLNWLSGGATLNPGKYYFAWTCSSATATLANTVSGVSFSVAGAGPAPSGGALVTGSMPSDSYAQGSLPFLVLK